MLGRAKVLGAAAAVALAGSALLSGPGVAGSGGKTFRLAMSGAQEFNAAGSPTNPHGDADQGSITLRLNAGREQICWSVSSLTLTAGEALPHAAHIHQAPAGLAGPVVVDLFSAGAPAAYPTSTTCVSAPRETVRAIAKDPAAYYVNLHNVQHPAGVVRAQLK